MNCSAFSWSTKSSAGSAVGMLLSLLVATSLVGAAGGWAVAAEGAAEKQTDVRLAKGKLAIAFSTKRPGPVVTYGGCRVFQGAFFKLRADDATGARINVGGKGGVQKTAVIEQTTIDGAPAATIRVESVIFGYRAEWTLVLEDERTFRVEYTQESDRIEKGMLSYCPLILSPTAVMGRTAAVGDGGQTVVFPLNPRPMEKRFFGLKNERKLVVYSRPARVTIEALDGTPGLDFVDFRAVSFANEEYEKGILIYDGVPFKKGRQRLAVRVRLDDPEAGPAPTAQQLVQAGMVPREPPKDDAAAGMDRAAPAAPEAAPATLVIPRPQQAEWQDGSLPLEGAAIWVSPSLPATIRARIQGFITPGDVAWTAGGEACAGLAVKESAELPALTIVVGQSAAAAAAAAAAAPALAIPNSLADWAREEAYQLDITPGGAILRAVGEKGIWNGWLTLAQLAARSGRRAGGRVVERALPCGRVVDWPALQFRGYHFNPRNTFPSQATNLALVRTFARLKFNQLVLQFKGDVQMKSIPEAVDPQRSWTQDQIREVVRTARALGIEAFPEIKAVGHTEWAHGGGAAGRPLSEFPRMKDWFDPSGKTFDPTSDEALRALLAYLDEMIELFDHPRIFHISADEAHTWATSERCKGQDPAKLLGEWIIKLHDHLKSRGCRTMMWGDMLLLKMDFSTQRASHAFNGTEKAIGALPRDIIIGDWHYQALTDFPSARYFKEQGFEVIGCPWDANEGTLAWGRQLAQQQALGILGTSWNRLMQRPDSYAVTAEAAWNPQAAAESLKDYDARVEMRRWYDREFFAARSGGLVFQPAETKAVPAEQAAPTEPRFTPLDLSPVANVSLSDERAADSKGWLDYGPLRDLGALPAGRQIIGGVPFDMPGAGRDGGGETERKAVMLYGAVPPCDTLRKETAKIAVGAGRAVSRVHLIGGCGFAPAGKTTVLTVRLHYADGSQGAVPLVYGRETLEWTAAGARFLAATPPCEAAVAWRGYTRDATPIQLWMLSLPADPSKTLQSISLIGEATEAAPFVVAISTETE